ncbi:hypothetical protein SAMN05444422_11391 [Halobiforma haloterrestris]|uniref:Sugar-specific transcriptional regulator TrmB n=1 Tax=Natronobacterium haloterrestre TaxID=148448 RepID=A0A1I1KZ64_NATHA|nr:MarR family transcriptional regulator [Halobiforma haloterrestris]SFC66041.1 hypothetical protein SAMN05444422_11391 [Halobiforma haloterrestris]
MNQKQLTSDSSRTLPSELESSQAKLVYLYLEATGGATAADLSGALSMKKLAILSVLNSLSSADLVEKTGTEYVPRAR